MYMSLHAPLSMSVCLIFSLQSSAYCLFHPIDVGPPPNPKKTFIGFLGYDGWQLVADTLNIRV